MMQALVNACMGHLSSPFNPLTLAVALALAAVPPAEAGDILRGGTRAAPTTNAPTATSGAATAQAAKAQANAADSLARTTAALQSVRAMQTAARKVALAGPDNLGKNPNFAGQTLPNVPNGLKIGGLEVAPGVPINLSAPTDSENATLWTGAKLPTQTISGGKTKITIVQTDSQALLNWKTFNIGKQTTVTFDQKAGGNDASKWIAFNQINDPTGNPTQILGSIDAIGQVYLINQNGILFGGSSQVNTHNLTASSLPINTNLVNQGLLNNRDAQFLFSGLSVPGGADGTPDFTPDSPRNGKFGDVTVQAGAKIVIPSSADGNGGRIFLAGSNVTNSGTLSTLNGQTILAAGLQVGVVAHSAEDPSLRGLDVFVGVVGEDAGRVVNEGIIDVPTASAWLAGREINQNGVIRSTTSVALNGRIDLIASYGAVSNPNFDNSGGGAGGPVFLFQNTGTVALGKNSSQSVLPDYTSTSTTPGTALPQKSQINIDGLVIHAEKDSILFAPNADLSIRAGIWAYQDQGNNRTIFDETGLPELGLSSLYANGKQRLLFSSGQVYLEPGSLISTAGSADVFVALAQNILNVQFRSAELSDSPLQRDGVLRGTSLTVDIRNTGVTSDGRYYVGTSLGDVTGISGLIERNAAQLTAQGGNVTLQAGGSIVLREGSTVDVSGGYYRYESGMVNTTRLLQDGRLVDIANADATQNYDGVYTGTFTENFAKYGISSTYQNALALNGEHFEESYLEGAAGGTLTMTAPTLAMRGELLGITVTGPKQRTISAAVSKLALSFTAEETLVLSGNTRTYLTTAPSPAKVIFSDTLPDAPLPKLLTTESTPLPSASQTPATAKPADVILSQKLLTENGFGSLSVINPDEDIVVPKGITVYAPVRGSITLAGANVTIQGDVVAPGGNLSFSAYNISPNFAEKFPLVNTSGALSPTPNTDRGVFLLAAGSRLDTAGLLTDDRPTNLDSLLSPIVVNGGTVSINSFSANLSANGSINVSGGIQVDTKGKVTYGNGGGITINTGKDLSLPTVTGGTLHLDSSLLGYAGGRGASLSLQTSAIQIGGITKNQQVLNLNSAFFQTGGFVSYALTGIGLAIDNPATVDPLGNYLPAITIAENTVIKPVAEQLRVTSLINDYGAVQVERVLNPVGIRTASGISFSALGSDDTFTTETVEIRGDLLMEEGARVVTDPGASIAFSGDTTTILGTLEAPGGSISLKGGSRIRLVGSAATNETYARATVFIGSKATLNVSGTSYLTPDPFNRRTGTLLAGGTINVSGNIVASQGSLLAASGATTTFDYAPIVAGTAKSAQIAPSSGTITPLQTLTTVPVRQDSNGGTIDLQGSQMLFADSTLVAESGGPTAIGGTLSIFSGLYYPELSSRTGADINLQITQTGQTISGANKDLGVGKGVLDEVGSVLRGMGYFTLNHLKNAGFNSLDLGYKYLEVSPIPYGGNILFDGPINIELPGSLRVAAGGVIDSTDKVNLKASYLKIGQEFRAPINPGDQVFAFQQDPAGNTREYQFSPTTGSGNLQLNGSLIDVGTLSLQHIGQATLTANEGDIRGNGTLNIAGDITLRAAQIYPTTASQFDIFAYDTPESKGSVTITKAGSRPTPSSVGGVLNIYASEINQNGMLKAPLGTINLGWNGGDLDLSSATVDQPVNAVAGLTSPIPVTEALALGKGSLTSVALDSDSTIPYGLSPDGFTWVDPKGVNITSTGLPEKQVSLQGLSISTNKGSVIDIRGGGDLYAYRWVTGNGGSRDILGTATASWNSGVEYQPGDLVLFGGITYSARVRHTSQTPTPSLYWSRVDESYAILPNYDFSYAPYAAFNIGSNADQLGGDPGYVNNLQIGSRIYLQASEGLKAGFYTLLPRRYAILPGSFLVTPTKQTAIGTISLPDQSNYVSGFLANAFRQPDTLAPLQSRYQVASAEIVRQRAEYRDYYANSFFAEAAVRLEIANPQNLPADAGYLSFQSGNMLSLQGSVTTTHNTNSRGAAIDISSTGDLYIVGGQGTAPQDAQAVLNARLISSWGAESLLLGGTRRAENDGIVLDVKTSNIFVDNAGGSLTSPEITLVAQQKITTTHGTSILAKGRIAQSIVPLTVNGDGVLLRVSNNLLSEVARFGVSNSTTALLTLGDRTQLSGSSITLDSSYGTIFAPTLSLTSDALTLNAGQISIVLDSTISNLEGESISSQLVISGQFLSDVEKTDRLTLSSYRTIDIYGSGNFGASSLAALSLSAAGIRGYGADSGPASITSGSLEIQNASNVTAASGTVKTSGSLVLNSGTVTLGVNDFFFSGYGDTTINAKNGLNGTGLGALTVNSRLTVNTPVITGNQSANHRIVADGEIILNSSESSSNITGDLGSTFAFSGTSITANSDIFLPSGRLSFLATAGDIVVGGKLDVSGSAKTFYDLIRYSNAGEISLTSQNGNIILLDGSNLSVSAASDGGKAGYITLQAANGAAQIAANSLSGSAKAGETSGSLTLDSGTLASYDTLTDILNTGGFHEERNVRVRNGDILVATAGDESAAARLLTISTDNGSIRVEGTLNAANREGGNINLAASNNLTIASGALLTTHAEIFSTAGKGGSITLEAGTTVNGIANSSASLSIEGGSTIDLAVDAFVEGDYTDVGSSAFNGQFTGTLHIRAPRSADNSDFGLTTFAGTITGASSILAEGFNVVDLTSTNGLITGWRSNFTALPSNNTVQRNIYNSAASYLSDSNYDAMILRLLGADTQGLIGKFVLAPGVEIVNRTGGLTIGSLTSTAVGSASLNSADWDLSDFRFGPKKAAGVLTLRANTNITLLNALSDGFRADDSSLSDAIILPDGTLAGQSLWLSPVARINEALPVNTQSWSFRIAAGSDLAAADFRKVKPSDQLASGTGSLLLGKNYSANLVSGANATTAAAINNRFQVIRTGTGNITIAAARDIQLRNQFATIYTAGVRLPTPTSIYNTGDFTTPIVAVSGIEHPSQSNLGAIQQEYTAQWTLAGGNLSLSAEQNIGRYTVINNVLTVDSSAQLPTNYLYRRGQIDQATGLFAIGGVDGNPSITDSSASTTWWIDFSNFFQGFGTLGGGDLKLRAGNDLVNADAVVATNARMPGRDAANNVNLRPDSTKLLELGGGDLSVRAGHNIDGGIYYLERGRGELFAGNEITTNQSRSPSLGILLSTPQVFDSLTWLPTTLFLGKGGFDVTALGNVLLGPISNPYLLPQGVNNKFWYKTYFNTYGEDSEVNVASYGGDVTHRVTTTLPGGSSPSPSLLVWLQQKSLFQVSGAASRASNFQPWIRLAESNVAPFSTFVTIAAPTLRSTSFTGDINLSGTINLFPSPTGGLEIAAAGSIIGLQPVGKTSTGTPSVNVTAYTSATINLSDADPARIPSISSPLAYQTFVGRVALNLRQTGSNFLVAQNRSFRETGSYTGTDATTAVQQALHDSNILHLNDGEPARIYASSGDITALTFYSAKSTRIIAGNDISDIQFYLQNTGSRDISTVSAGRDIIAYNENTSIRSFASNLTLGNSIFDTSRTSVNGTTTTVLSGDIQINGPGTVEVIAGRNLDLGNGANFTDGTGTGITSIGNFRNPYLPFTGADIITLAGVTDSDGNGAATSLDISSLHFDDFFKKYSADLSLLTSAYMAKIGESNFDSLTDEEKAIVGLELFYLELRNTGQAYATTQTYAPGYDAIDTLFGSPSATTQIFTRSRDIRSATGGAVSIAAPTGSLTLASDIFGNPLTPPGIVTEFGGAISIFTDRDVDIGLSRIFTLRGGDIIIWSSAGNIAAGSAAKTVVTAPPTRVVFDVTSANVQTDLGGLATGGGIGVLASVVGVPPGDVSLIAPQGFVDAGDAGIRSTGNLLIAAVQVLNADNIAAAGTSTGVPAPVAPPALNLAVAAPQSNTTANTDAASEAQKKAQQQTQQEDLPSIIIVEVLGYGG